MIDDETRRKVARRLRVLAETPDEIGITEHAVVSTLGISEGIYDDSCRSEDVLIVADLIDRPTCHIVSTISYDWSDGTEYAHKLSCGHTCYTDCPEPSAYCCKCGCRVVEKEDMAYDPDYEVLFDE